MVVWYNPVAECSSNHITFIEGTSIHCQNSTTYLTKPCGTIDIIPSPLDVHCDLTFHITLSIRKYVILKIDHLGVMNYDCESTYLAVYQTPSRRSDELIRFIQCVRHTAGELIKADWNTMTVVWHRGREPEYGSTTKVFLATYYGKLLEVKAAQGEREADQTYPVLLESVKFALTARCR